jgi:hypothetical protein
MAADKKISELPVSMGISANDISILVNNGVDYQFSISLLLQYLANNLTSGTSISFGTTLPQNNTGKNGDVYVKTDTSQFLQKTGGNWAVVYKLPDAASINSSLLYGVGLPGANIGKDNDSFINTLTGVFYLKNDGIWSQVFSMQTGPAGPKGDKGDTGLSGSNGKTILNGVSNPSNLLGTDGDFYINTSAFRFFGPKTNGIWGSGTSMFFTPTEPYSYKFSVGKTNPITILNWQSEFYNDYGNAEFSIQFIDEDGNLQDRPDLGIKRIIDRSGPYPIQTGISLDVPEYMDGQIIIKYSNLTLK